MDGRVLAIAAATFFTAVAPAAANHRDNSLQALWLFDEKYGQAAYDISGHGNHGVLGSTTGRTRTIPSESRAPRATTATAPSTSTAPTS